MATVSSVSDSNRWRGDLLYFVIATMSALACWFVAGTSLDFFLGGLVLAALLTPPLSLPWRIRGGLMVVCGISVVWLASVFDSFTSLLSWINCVLVLASFVAVMVCASQFLRRLRIAPIAVSGIVTLISLAWLSWPIWLSGNGPVEIHPLFAINFACQNLGIWTEQRIAYHLTRLGQDVAYRLPGSIWPTVVFNLGLVIVSNLFGLLTRKSRSSPR